MFNTAYFFNQQLILDYEGEEVKFLLLGHFVVFACIFVTFHQVINARLLLLSGTTEFYNKKTRRSPTTYPRVLGSRSPPHSSPHQLILIEILSVLENGSLHLHIGIINSYFSLIMR